MDGEDGGGGMGEGGDKHNNRTETARAMVGIAAEEKNRRGGGEGRVVVDPNSREGPADGGDEVLGAREVKDSIGGRWTNGVWAALQ